MLKGSLSPYLDTHNEEESSYVTLSNGPYAYVTESSSKEQNSYNHVLLDVYFLTPILCKHCEDYIWGTGKVGVKCKDRSLDRSKNSPTRSSRMESSTSRGSPSRAAPLHSNTPGDSNDFKSGALSRPPSPSFRPPRSFSRVSRRAGFSPDRNSTALSDPSPSPSNPSPQHRTSQDCI